MFNNLHVVAIPDTITADFVIADCGVVNIPFAENFRLHPSFLVRVFVDDDKCEFNFASYKSQLVLHELCFRDFVFARKVQPPAFGGKKLDLCKTYISPVYPHHWKYEHAPSVSSGLAFLEILIALRVWNHL